MLQENNDKLRSLQGWRTNAKAAKHLLAGVSANGTGALGVLSNHCNLAQLDGNYIFRSVVPQGTNAYQKNVTR